MKLLCNSEKSLAFMGSLCEYGQLLYKMSILLNVPEEGFEKIFLFKMIEINSIQLVQPVQTIEFSYSF